MAVVAAAGGGDDGKVAPPPIVTMPSDERKQNYIDKVKRLSRMHTKERPMSKLAKMVEEEDDDENNNSGTHPVTIDPQTRARNILQVLQQHQQEHDVLDWEFGKLVGQQQRQHELTNEDIDTYLSSKQKALQTLITNEEKEYEHILEARDSLVGEEETHADTKVTKEVQKVFHKDVSEHAENMKSRISKAKLQYERIALAGSRTVIQRKEEKMRRMNKKKELPTTTTTTTTTTSITEEKDQKSSLEVEEEEQEEEDGIIVKDNGVGSNDDKEKEGEEDNSPPPTTQPTSTTTSDSLNYYNQYNNNPRQIYLEQIFNTRMEEYDMIKFDPYSFSGAPLGGWGRATRSRLATLPLRLVLGGESDDEEYGLFNSYGDVVTASENDEEEKKYGEDAVYEDGDSDVLELSDESILTNEHHDKETSSSSSSKDEELLDDNGGIVQQRSTGPYFTIYDATGQQFICRLYPENELIVSSRIDSMFYPAIHTWDYHADESKYGDDGMEKEEEEDGSSTIDKFHFSFGNGGDGTNSLPEVIRSSVSNVLRQLGMVDAAQALLANNNDNNNNNDGNPFVNIDAHQAAIDAIEGGVRMVMVDQFGNIIHDNGDNVNMNGNGMDIADIIRAAALGAGVASDNVVGGEDDNAGGGDESKKVDRGSKPFSSTSKPPQLSVDEINKLLESLKGVCAQLHDGGWWSYEWCHEEGVRQFHVAYSTDSPPRYEIQDVTLIGQYAGVLVVVYPKGIYGGKHIDGVTTTIQFDGNGEEVLRRVSVHGPDDDSMFPSDIFTDEGITHLKRTNIGNERGPVVIQTFTSGDYCEEKGIDRVMKVELRCCTEDEIDKWLESKKMSTTGSSGEKEETPQAVLVKVWEDETCVYSSKVCTPLLCPQETVQDDPSVTSAANDVATKITPDLLINDDPLTDMKDLLMGSNEDSTSSSSSSSIMDIKGGESIREILDKTLGRLPCLTKNLGW